MAQYDFGQELWPDDRTLSSISWRDRLRDLAQDYGGERGRQKVEQLIGESEEDKYMRMLLQEYGYEGVPEDAPTERSFMQSVIDPADIGGVDMGLMGVSALGSVAPKLAATSAGTETSLLLGDAIGEYNEGNLQGAGLMVLLAFAPGLLNILSRGGQQAKEGIETLTEETPLLLDKSKRNFLKAIGTLTAGGTILGKTMKNTPTPSIIDDVAKVAETAAPAAKVNTGNFLNRVGKVYDALKLNELEDDALLKHLPEEMFPDKGFSYEVKQTKAEDNFDLFTNVSDDEFASQKAQQKLQMDFFEEYGLEKDDLLNIEEEGVAYELNMLDDPIETYEMLGNQNADPGSYKKYDIYAGSPKVVKEPDYVLQDLYDRRYDVSSGKREETLQAVSEVTGIPIEELEEAGVWRHPGVSKHVNLSKSQFATGDYIETYTVDGVPMVQLGHSSDLGGSYMVHTMPSKEAIAKLRGAD